MGGLQVDLTIWTLKKNIKKVTNIFLRQNPKSHGGITEESYIPTICNNS
jgi:hypothetical protein